MQAYLSVNVPERGITVSACTPPLQMGHEPTTQDRENAGPEVCAGGEERDTEEEVEIEEVREGVGTAVEGDKDEDAEPYDTEEENEDEIDREFDEESEEDDKTVEDVKEDRED